MSKYHSLPIRVFLEDTDAGGIVYHANYLRYAERGRSEALRELGGCQRELKEQGIITVVRSCHINFLAPARLNDVLEVRTHFKKPGRAKFEATQVIIRDDKILATLDVVLACINPEGRPIRLDTSFVNKLWTHFGGI